MKLKIVYAQTLILAVGLILTALSGLNWNIAIAAWLAPVFLLNYAKNVKWPGFIVLFIGLSLSLGLSKSGENLAEIAILYIAIGLSYGLLFLIPYIIERLLNKNEKKFYTTLIFPSAFVFAEYLFSLKFGLWGNSSIAQYSNFNLIQISAISGIYGITFLVGWFASVINWMIKNHLQISFIKKGVILYGSIISIVLLFGEIRTSLFPPAAETVKTAAIISNTDLHKITENLQEEMIELSKNYDLPIPEIIFSNQEAIDRQIEKTKLAAHHGAKIIVWNESSLILKSLQLDSLLQETQEICKKNKVYVLLAFVEKNESTLPKPFNNKSIFITPEGEIAWEYIKSYPHPVEGMITNQGNSVLPYIDTEYGRIGSLICSDMDLTKLASKAGKNRVDIMLIPAFDWEGITPYHPYLNIFQSIQFGFSMVRSNGKGLTIMSDYQGNILAKHNSLTSDSEIIYAELPIKSITTIYSIIGNILAYIAMLILLLVVGLRIAKR